MTFERDENLNQRTQSLRGLTRNSTTFAGRYNGTINTARNLED